jgi:hypothetical protein
VRERCAGGGPDAGTGPGRADADAAAGGEGHVTGDVLTTGPRFRVAPEEGGGYSLPLSLTVSDR